ncbi:MAG: organomercurial lyase [Gammaproteobacteria bacterium]
MDPSTRRASDNDIRLRIYDHFVRRGQPPVPVELSAELGISSDEVEAAFRRLADDHVLVLVPGTPYIWFANPLCALPSPFSVEAQGRRWWGACIWDALGILAMLGTDGTVSTACPDCAEPLEVSVRGGEVSGEGVAHYVVPAARWWDDIGFT